MSEYYLAVDIGASSGRHIIGKRRADGSFDTDEVYRFKNGVTECDGHLVWDIEALYKNVVEGIRAAFARYGKIKSLAIDTWGVDYVLLKGERAVSPCYSYRDGRTHSVTDRVHKRISFARLYEKTGIQFQPFNTVYQLFDDLERGRLDDVTDFSMIPEYLTYRLTGVKAHEYTNATTTGLVNAVTGEYDSDIIDILGLPRGMFGKTVKPGTAAGRLLPEVAAYVGGDCDAVFCASHDTASAVEGIPMRDDVRAAYISSGTWSLLGVKTERALTDAGSREANYSNEGGVGYVRYQKNIPGMWVVNRLKDELCPDAGFDELVNGARESDFNEYVDLGAPAFLAPDSMVHAFDELLYSRPEHAFDYFKSAFISLAHGYKTALDELERNTNTAYSELYIVGGGAKNKYLNELTQSITGKTVIALAIEATAIGNLKIQATRSLTNV